MNDFLKNNKLLNWGIFALITLVVLYFLGTRAGKSKTASNTGKAYEKELTKSGLTYELSQYASFADRLESAMFGFTDDEAAIYDVFSKLRTKTDLLQVIQTFGNRRLSFTIGSANLPVWINYRLNKSEIQKLNEILNRNSIDFQF